MNVFGQADDYYFEKPEFEFKEGIYLDLNQLKLNRPLTILNIDQLNRNISAINPNGDSVNIWIRDIHSIVRRGKLNVFFDYEWYDLKASEWDDYVIGNDMGILIPLYKKLPTPQFSGAIIDHAATYAMFGLLGTMFHVAASLSPEEMDFIKDISVGNFSGNPDYILNFSTGKVSPFGTSSVEFYLKKDPVIYKEYKASKLPKSEKLIDFIRTFNTLHPLTFNGEVVTVRE